MDSEKLKAMDAVLSSVANAHHADTPAQLCLALVARAGAAHSDDVRMWLRLRNAHDPALMRFLKSSAWPRLVAAQTRLSERTPDAHLAILRTRLAGALFSSLSGAAPDREQKMKAALAVAYIRLEASLKSDTPMDSILLSAPELALALGCTRVTALKLLHEMVDHKLLNRVAARPGSASRFRIAPLNRAQRAALKLVDESALNQLFESGLIQAVEHPAFGFTESGHKPWLMAVSMMVQAAPESVGFRRRDGRVQVRALVAEMGLLEPGLVESLDGWAELLGGDVKHKEAAEQRAFEIELRVGELELVKAATAKAKSGLDMLADDLGGIPSGKSSPGFLEAWAVKMNASIKVAIENAPAGPYLAPAISKELARRAERLAWDAESRKYLFAA